MACAGEGRQLARGDDELGTQDGAHAGQGFDDVGLGVGAEGLPDLLVDVLEPAVQGQDLRCDFGGDVLAGQGGVLCLGGLQGRGGDRVGVEHFAACQPGGEVGLTAAGVWLPGSGSRRAG